MKWTTKTCCGGSKRLTRIFCWLLLAIRSRRFGFTAIAIVSRCLWPLELAERSTIAGNLKRAPKWVQWMQLEWLFRLAQEPFRLLPRYTRDAVALLMHLPLGLAANRMQPEERRHGRLKVQVEGTVRVIATPAKLSGDVCSWLAREAKQAVTAGQTMVVDMSATVRVEADGLGGLLEARRILLAEGLWIWLAGMSNPVRRVLQFSAMSDLFRIAATPAEAVHFTIAAQSPASRMNESSHDGLVRGMSVVNTNTSIARAS